MYYLLYGDADALHNREFDPYHVKLLAVVNTFILLIANKERVA